MPRDDADSLRKAIFRGILDGASLAFTGFASLEIPALPEPGSFEDDAAKLRGDGERVINDYVLAVRRCVSS